MASLINRAAVKQLILERAKVIKPAWPATRVAKTSVDFVEARIRNLVDDALRRHPSIGVTVQLQ